MAIELFVLFLLIALGGVFAMSELALVSVRKSRLEQLAQEGDSRAAAALTLLDSPQTFLSSCQCGITLISTLAGVFGGATIAERLEPSLRNLPFLGAYSGALSFGVIVVSITYVTIVLGELVPKTVAMTHAEPIALAVSRPLSAFLRMSYPLVNFLSGSTTAVLKLFRIKESAGSEVTQDEIEIMLDQGAESGVLEPAEHAMVDRVFRLGDQMISVIMTPRKDVVWIDLNDDVALNMDKIAGSNHSHFPVCDGSPDKVIGMVSVKDILLRVNNKELVNLRDVLTPPLFVPDNLPALRVLNQFKETNTHFAVILDEYGSMEGVVTLNDFMGSILGELSTPTGQEEPVVVTREDGTLLIDGKIPIADLKECLEVSALFEEERGDYKTLAGMILVLLGRIPSIGDTVEWEQFRFEIVDMDDRRIDRVLVTRMSA